ncbi:glycine/D-amino acid oxidase-like deaminating enzyme [Algoriphagus ratkowskyi]|uniref:FAD-binding oxidoreductase n=1 Tax=Algoriphagus ratkowskyi TaxID=57028 RepID=A0A2W7RGG6_9BACT|nr:FAD-binding oxidoreductase [Algoriphagus ratkowskyi]PZX59261.1 glycine/D-amino acid oxidase-like deaminating enzyme [Algoriphagus ratkowskyi]TXD77464.1 FAD-binding oxidoreductase [Algoriphagus ratkowskyi]
MFSYWEKKHFFHYDLIVVGAGFVGLSTAIHYKAKRPKANVLVLERGIFPTGASTKNAGFACFGSLTEILDDLNHMSHDEVLALVGRRHQGLKAIRRQFGKKKLEYSHSSGYELLEQHQLDAVDKMKDVNCLLHSVFKDEVFSLVKKPMKMGFSDQVKVIVKNKFEGELDPGMYMDSLWQLAQHSGIRILTGVSVCEVQKNEGTVLAEDGAGKVNLEFKGNKIAICTNAFTKKLWPDSDIEPGRGLILLSKPLDFKILWKGTFHLDKGYVYFRQIDGRLLLGGARNKDFEGEKSIDFEVNPKIKSHLKNIAMDVIFPGKQIGWDMEWTGVMAFGKIKSPLIQRIGPKTVAAVRLGGMGVAIGWQVGKELSELLTKM